MIRNLFVRLMVIAVTIAPFISAEVSATEMMEAYGTEMAYADARENLKMAIAERGLVISSVSHVGEMLERTGKDLGATKKIYEEAEIYEFCSAVLSRRMMEADERNIAFCPFSIALYSLPHEPGKVYAAFRRPAVLAPSDSADALLAVEDMLRAIARQTLELE